MGRFPSGGCKRRFHRCDRVGSPGSVGATGLSHIRPAAAALTAEGCRGLAYQIDGTEALREVVGDADHDACLAVLTGPYEDDDAGAEALLALVGERLQVLRRHAAHRPA